MYSTAPSMDVTNFIYAFFMCAGLAQGFQLIPPCTETDQSSCIEHDTTSDLYYLDENITVTLTMRFNALILTELWLDPRKIVLLTAGERTLNLGQEITDSQERNRWSLEFTFTPSKGVYGKLNLSLHIQHIQHLRYRDERLLHVEVRTESTVFKTEGKTWIPFPERRFIGATEQEAQGVTTENFASEETLDNLLANKNHDLRKENEALQQTLTTMQNDLIQYQKKYIRTLEINNNLSTHGPNFPVNVLTCIAAMCGLFMVALLIYKLFKIVSSTFIHTNKPLFVMFDHEDREDYEQL